MFVAAGPYATDSHQVTEAVRAVEDLRKIPGKKDMTYTKLKDWLSTQPEEPNPGVYEQNVLGWSAPTNMPHGNPKSK